MALTKNYTIDKKQGFTLVELVIVIIVLGILTAVALPKLLGKSAFEDYTVKDQLIARLRLVQLQNMNADPGLSATNNACYWVVTKPACFYSEHTVRSAGLCATPSASVNCNDDGYNQYNIVTFSEKMLTTSFYHFDQQGRLTTGNNTVTLLGDNNLSITIESEGYIHE